MRRPLVIANPSVPAPMPAPAANSDPRQPITGEALNGLDAGNGDYLAMIKYWDKVACIVEGTEAMRDAHALYLPKFPNESDASYNFRWKNAKFTNVYRDVLENLASKPFEQEVELVTKSVDKKDDAAELPQQFKDFIEDVDGTGNNLTVFAADTFFNGINSAIDWIWVDYPDAPIPEGRARTIAEEKALGLRPFWTHVLASNVLDVRSKVINGKEQITYIRFKEHEPDGLYIRIIQMDDAGAWWQHYKETKNKVGSIIQRFEYVDGGPISIGVVPMVPFMTGRRKGRSWQFYPMMRDAADLQIELFQDESGLKNIKALSGFPMLTGNGVSPEYEGTGKNKVPKTLQTGPDTVLYAPANGQGGTGGSWVFISPEATILTFLQSDVGKTIEQLRELGRNPLTAQSGNLTVITAGVAAKKGNSAVQMWAFTLKNALENAMVLTGMWFKIPQSTYDPEVKVFTDFEVDGSLEDLKLLLDARKNGDISRKTLWHEMVRRGLLSGEFDPDAEIEALLEDMISSEENTDPLTGEPKTANTPPAA